MDFQAIILNIFSFKTLGILSATTMYGMIAGALPGVSSTMAVSLFLPFTFVMDPATGILSLMAIYTSSVYGGSITAILLNTPGTGSSAATAIDGYKMTQQGKGALALRMSTFASGLGGIISGLALLLFSPPLSKISLYFGPSEFFLLACLGLSSVASLADESILKGILSGVFGLFLVTIGIDYSVGIPRFTFGYIPLESGISFVPALIGLFAFSQAIKMTLEIKRANGASSNKVVSFFTDRLIPSWQELKGLWGTFLRGSIIGVIIGILPGAGTEIASWISYNTEKKVSRSRKEIGHGSVVGVAASEVANNAGTGATLIPLLTMGVPGSPVAAVILGGLMIHGLIPGRDLFTVNAGITYTAMFGFIFANVLMVTFGVLLIKTFVLVTRISEFIVTPMIIVLCFIGAFCANNSFYGVGIMIIFGFIGYLMNISGFNPAPTVLAMVLGPMAEARYLQMVAISDNHVLRHMFSRPISITLIVLIGVFLFAPTLFKNIEAGEAIK